MAAQAFTNGTGRCSTGVENAANIKNLEKRVDMMGQQLQALEHELEERCTALERTVNQMDKEHLTARLSTSSAILVAIIAGFFSVVGSLIAAYAATR